MLFGLRRGAQGESDDAARLAHRRAPELRRARSGVLRSRSRALRRPAGAVRLHDLLPGRRALRSPGDPRSLAQHGDLGRGAGRHLPRRHPHAPRARAHRARSRGPGGSRGAGGALGGKWQPVLSALTEEVYVTFDLDALDPSVLPATGTPEPGGLDWYEAVDLLRAVSERASIVGFDIVELAPIPGQVASDFLAARLTYRAIGLALAGVGTGVEKS